MIFKKEISPYLASGGCPTDQNSWLFFTPKGEVIFSGVNEALKIILPLCSGENSLDSIKNMITNKFSKEEVSKLFEALFENMILVDCHQIYQNL